ncbi:colicin V production protein [mine drainage metagenome]|uniref:Colicin V production protein n=1 Tax=mine drainage metagenome TaxID=410659 RepID=T1C0M3_9ZZZZ
MNWVDIVFILVIGLSFVFSLLRGFIHEALALVVWILAFLLAAKAGPWVGRWLVLIVHSPAWRLGLGEGIVFIAVLLVGGILVSHIGAAVHKSPLGFMDRLLGGVFGLARGVLIVCVLVWLGQMAHLEQKPYWRESRLIPRVQPVEGWLVRHLPPLQAG